MKPIYKIMFFISISLVVLAVAATVIFGLNLSADFKGGTLMEVQFVGSEAPNISELQDFVKESPETSDAVISPSGAGSFIFRLKEIDEDVHQKIINNLKLKFTNLEEKRFDSVGAVVGGELKSRSVTAIVLVFVFIVLYIVFVFRKLYSTLSSFTMGVAAIVALLHDVLIPMGIFALLGRYYGIEITAVFVAAVLTILGYSVSDTVVVFDRIRENVTRFGGKNNFGQLVHDSVLQTLTRSLNTTITTLLSLVAIYFFGGESIKYFSLALIIGIFLGAYSSIFVASPIVVWWSKKN